MSFSTYFQNQPTREEINKRVEGFSTWIEINLDNIGFNLEQARALSGVEIIPCLKKNAYAHGIAPVTAYLMSNGVQRVLVAKLWEAQAIRRAGLDCGVINMDPIYTEEQYRWAVEQGVSQVIYHRESAEKLSRAADGIHRVASVWVKVDTGLGRVGVNWVDAPDLIEYIAGLPGLRVDGLFSTLLEDDMDFTQIERLKQVKETLSNRDIDMSTLSIASSHGIFLRPESSLDAVRPGVMLFGWYPMPEARETRVELRQALCLKGRLEHVKWVEPGTPLTYGGAFVAPRRMKIGTMHMGYSDGYLRQLSKKGIVNVGGKICPIIGGVSINHMIVDLSGTDAEIGDVVEAISMNGANDAHNLCELAGVEPYQLAVWMSPITPRIYYIGREPVAIVEPELG
ncbi:alanine racemase [Candidatus Bathyarchaeota archaeon]|nr:MAG: alanine racemase [Candidatus Bathyarchaeota archaeon]